MADTIVGEMPDDGLGQSGNQLASTSLDFTPPWSAIVVAHREDAERARAHVDELNVYGLDDPDLHRVLPTGPSSCVVLLGTGAQRAARQIRGFGVEEVWGVHLPIGNDYVSQFLEERAAAVRYFGGSDHLKEVLDAWLDKATRLDCLPESHPDLVRAPQLRLRLRSRSEILAIPPTRWLIKNYLTCGSVVLTGADPNVGKSTLANAWAHCIWTGTPWLGHAVRAGSVLFILGEDSRGAALRARAWEAAYGPLDPVSERYIQYADKLPALCEPDGQLELRRLLQFLVQQHGHAPALVVIDTLSTVWGSEPENSAELAAALMAVLSALADEFDCTFLLIHHLNKVPPGPTKREITLSGIRGAGAFVGSADDVLALEATAEGARLFGLKARNTDKATEKRLSVHRVSLGTNEDGDEVSSVILIEAPPLAILSPEAMEKATQDKAWNAAEQHVHHAVDTLTKMGSARSRTAIANRMTGKRGARFAAIDDAMSRELIIDVGTDRKHHFVVAGDPQCVSHNTPHTPEPGTGNRSPAGAGPGSVPSESGTGSQTAGTGNRSAVPVGMDDGMPETPKRRRKAKAGGGA